MFKRFIFAKLLIVLLFLSCGVKKKINNDLYNAVLLQNEDQILEQLNKGANVNYIKSTRGWSMLLYATEQNNTSLIKLLIDNGANVNFTALDDNVTALHRAASKGNIKAVQLLIDKGANVNSLEDKLRSTPLIWAAANGHNNVVNLLLNNGAYINARGYRGTSALLLAVEGEYIEVVKTLIKRGAIKNRPNTYGITPLQKAQELNNTTIINLLKNEK